MSKITAQHILVDQKFEAEDILKKLQIGSDFSVLVKDFLLADRQKMAVILENL